VACELVLGGRTVRYVLRQSSRRTLALQVDARRGVRVSVPLRTPPAAVEQFLQTHGDWLLRKLDALEQRPVAECLPVEDGVLFPLLGVPCRLRLGGAGRRPAWRMGADGLDELLLPASTKDPAATWRRALQQRALQWFGGRVAECCHRLNVPVPAVRLSSARTRWGSCSRVSGIRLHWRLIHLQPALIDYVVAHEAAHLIEMNHSARFWSVVASLYPDWQNARRQLHEAGRTLPLLGPSDDQPITRED
jgi:predicted metal-dependent hydrolase